MGVLKSQVFKVRSLNTHSLSKKNKIMRRKKLALMKT